MCEACVMRACLPLRGQHRLGARSAPPVSRFTEGSCELRHHQRQQSSPGKPPCTGTVLPIGGEVQCYDISMLDDLELLATKVGDLASLVQSLRTENQQVRAQLATATGELDAMRSRVDEASRRLDLLMERLPTPANPAKVPWNT